MALAITSETHNRFKASRDLVIPVFGQMKTFKDYKIWVSEIIATAQNADSGAYTGAVSLEFAVDALILYVRQIITMDCPQVDAFSRVGGIAEVSMNGGFAEIQECHGILTPTVQRIAVQEFSPLLGLPVEEEDEFRQRFGFDHTATGPLDFSLETWLYYIER